MPPLCSLPWNEPEGEMSTISTSNLIPLGPVVVNDVHPSIVVFIHLSMIHIDAINSYHYDCRRKRLILGFAAPMPLSPWARPPHFAAGCQAVVSNFQKIGRSYTSRFFDGKWPYCLKSSHWTCWCLLYSTKVVSITRIILIILIDFFNTSYSIFDILLLQHIVCWSGFGFALRQVIRQPVWPSFPITCNPLSVPVIL